MLGEKAQCIAKAFEMDFYANATTLRPPREAAAVVDEAY
jgi:hypothetical protein